MNEDKFKQLFNKTIDKMISNPDELFDNHKLTKKYNEKLKENIRLKKQLEAYENMRKEAIKFIRDRTRLIKIIDKIDEFELDLYLKENEINELLNILNKIGGSDE